MARIKITDLQADVMISKEEMKRVFGGLTYGTTSPFQSTNLSAIEEDPWHARTNDSSLSIEMDPIGTRVLKLNEL